MVVVLCLQGQLEGQRSFLIMLLSNQYVYCVVLWGCGQGHMISGCIVAIALRENEWVNNGQYVPHLWVYGCIAIYIYVCIVFCISFITSTYHLFLFSSFLLLSLFIFLPPPPLTYCWHLVCTPLPFHPSFSTSSSSGTNTQHLTPHQSSRVAPDDASLSHEFLDTHRLLIHDRQGGTDGEERLEKLLHSLTHSNFDVNFTSREQMNQTLLHYATQVAIGLVPLQCLIVYSKRCEVEQLSEEQGYVRVGKVLSIVLWTLQVLSISNQVCCWGILLCDWSVVIWVSPIYRWETFSLWRFLLLLVPMSTARTPLGRPHWILLRCTFIGRLSGCWSLSGERVDWVRSWGALGPLCGGKQWTETQYLGPQSPRCSQVRKWSVHSQFLSGCRIVVVLLG